MKRRDHYKGIPQDQRKAVMVYMSDRLAQGVKLTPQQAWAEWKADDAAQAQAKSAQERADKAQREEKRKSLFNADRAHDVAGDLAGVSEILLAVVEAGGHYADAAALARKAVDNANEYVSELAMFLR